MSESQNVQVVRQVIRAVSDFDFDTVEQLVSEDIVVEQPFATLGMAEKMKGRDAFIAGLRFVPTMFHEFKLNITAVYDCPDENTVVFEQTSAGIFNVDGSSYANRYIMIFGFCDGKISIWKEGYDARIMYERMTPVMVAMGTSKGSSGAQ